MSGHRAFRATRDGAVLSVDEPACNHNGGHIAFGPDGYLWIGFGDGGGANDMFNHGQNLDSLLATMVRIDPQGLRRERPTPSPPTTRLSTAGPGLRFGPTAPAIRGGSRSTQATGDLWIADVGQNEWEEIHVLLGRRRMGTRLQPGMALVRGQ